MPNTAGAYQPFGSGWQNLNNYLTSSNLGSTGTNWGGANMGKYQNPDAGSQFDDWLTGINSSRKKDDISTNLAPVNPYTAPEPKAPRQTPQQIAQQRRQQQLDEEQDNVQNPYERR